MLNKTILIQQAFDIITKHQLHNRCTLTLCCFSDAWLLLSGSNSHSPLVGHQGWLPQLVVLSCFQTTSDAVTSHSCKPTTSVQQPCHWTLSHQAKAKTDSISDVYVFHWKLSTISAGKGSFKLDCIMDILETDT
jgi:hypothetical protein